MDTREGARFSIHPTHQADICSECQQLVRPGELVVDTEYDTICHLDCMEFVRESMHDEDRS